MEDQFFRQHISPLFTGYLDQSGKDTAAAGNDPQLFLTVLLLKHGNRINFPVSKEGKGLSFSNDTGGNQRRNLLIKIPFQIFTFLISDLAEIHQFYSITCNIFQ